MARALLLQNPVVEDSKGILGIENRTENWKTAVYFSPLFDGKSNRLAELLGEAPRLQSGDVQLELFWRGMRDFFFQCKLEKESAKKVLAHLYTRLFPNLRREVEESGNFRTLQPQNYDVSTKDRMFNLVNNLANTEIDVVLETPNYLFVGEAKHEMSFGANGNLVLVHQLIRQYVTATILIEFSPSQIRKKVIPFVIGDSFKKMMNNSQVKFMIDQGWLKKQNVLQWDEIRLLAHPNYWCGHGHLIERGAHRSAEDIDSSARERLGAT